MDRRAFLALVGACSLCPFVALAGSNYPNRPVTIMVPFAPGGPNDVVARLLAERLRPETNSTFVIENRGGAGGTVGTGVVARAKPDGYTLLVGTTATLTISPHLYKNLAYDPVKSFAPIAMLTSSPLIIAVHRSVPATNLAELVAHAKEKKGSLSFGSPGRGSIPHLAGELFQKATGTTLTHVGYRGGSAALSDLIGGHVQVVFESPPGLLAQRGNPDIRLLAVTSRERLPNLPDLPTVQEAGIAGYEVVFWNGLLAPAGTPASIVSYLEEQVRKALSDAATKETFEKQGLTPAFAPGDAFAARIRTDLSFWSEVVKTAGISPE